MKVLCEIKEVKSKKLASLDMEYSIRLSTNDPRMLDLGKIPSDCLVMVELKTEEGKEI